METIAATVRPQIAIVLEYGGGNWGAYAPAVPGCVATGATAEECRQQMEEALSFQFEGLAEEGEAELAGLAEEARRELEPQR